MSDESAIPYQEIDHTADLALRIDGADLDQLFRHAAHALFDQYGEADPNAAPHTFPVHLEAPDRETLLVDWLNELLYLAEVHELVLDAFTIRCLTSTSMDGEAQGRPPTHRHKAIKAATFYDLCIATVADGLTVTVTFDV